MSTSNVERHERVCRIFLAAIEHTAEPRERFVADACGADADLRAEVERWLAAHDQAERGDDALEGELPIQALSAALLDRLRADLQHDVAGDCSSTFRFPRDIGAYVLLGVLGEGGMGIVYVAEQKHPPRRVALKMIRPSLASASSLRRFDVEARTLARLQHPGIAQIHDAGEIELDGERRAYLAMELVEGMLLGAFAARTDVDDAQRMRVLVALCLAVHHAHQKGVIHRDLKPGNVIVDADGRPRVLDFGVARLVDDPASLTTQDTLAARLVGTLPYMSPEHFAGDAHALDTRSDVYSLGVIAYELLSGRLPHDFTRKNLPEVARVVRDESPPLLGAVDARFRGDVEAIVSKALEKEPERRYASALDLARDLERHLAHEPVTARPPSTTYRLRRFARRNRAVVVSVVALVLALGAGFATSTTLYVRAEDRARKLLQLSDFRNVEVLVRRADTLWPPVPDLDDAYVRWLREADDRIGRRGLHQANLSALRAHALRRSKAGEEPGESISEAGFVYASPDDAWWDDQLVAVLAAFDSLSDPIAGLARSARAGDWSIARRLEFARSIEERAVTGADAARRWREAVESIADVRECPRYRGLRIVPQLGLLPLRRDPRSRLWEFVHVASGDEPGVDGGTGEWSLEKDTGIVLVLLPGGHFYYRNRLEGPSRHADHRDLLVDVDRTFVMPAFFLAKYELTQAQYVRLAGNNPSSHLPGTRAGGHTTGWLQPVERVRRDDARAVLRRFDLALPSDEQWMYAAEADWPQDERWPQPWEIARALRLPFGNFADSCLNGAESYLAHDADADDGHAGPAPVGTYPPNAFGLHEMLGNVFEWVDAPPEALVSHRGGGYQNLASQITPLTSLGNMPTAAIPVIGVRTARELRKPR